MQPIHHGGDRERFRHRFPDAPEPLIDLSTGINPIPYPIAPGPPEDFTRLPGAAALEALQAAAAAAYGAPDPAMAVVAPGTQLLINLLPRVLPQPSIAVFGPTYAEHAPAWRDAGTVVHEVTDPAALGHHGAALLCNPNNPDGRRIAPEALLELSSRLRLLVVDEAFADFEPEHSAVPMLRDGIVVLRSFGKAYGLAGLRLGFALATPPTAALIRRALGPWAVSGPALRIGRTALADRGWLQAAGARLQTDAARLDRLLAAAGCRLRGGTRLFRLVDAPDTLSEHLARRGIIVRSFLERPGILRFGLPAPREWDRLEHALATHEAAVRSESL